MRCAGITGFRSIMSAQVVETCAFKCFNQCNFCNLAEVSLCVYDAYLGP